MRGAHSMARACNELARRAAGAPDDILGFVHQDVRLGFDAATILPRYLERLPDAGVLGFCGSARQVPGRQWHRCPPCYGGLIQGENPATPIAFETPRDGIEGLRHTEVETLDGYCLFIRRDAFDRIGGFDEGYDGWHGYDLDLCTRALAAGYRNYVIAQPSRHISWGSSGPSLDRALERYARLWSAFLATSRPGRAASAIATVVPDKRLSIHVYAIARNEEAFAARFATSCAAADGVHVLDTGSTDATVAILRERGVHVEVAEISPWRFDLARNRSLELVPDDADVCLSIDLDEVLVPGWRAIVERAWTPGTTRLDYQYAWEMRDGRPHRAFHYDKCHSRHGYAWITPVHEVVTPVAGFVESRASTPEVLVQHFPDPSKSRAQYLPLLELAVREDGDDVRSRYYLGREYTYVARWQDAIDTLAVYLRNDRTWPFERASACMLIAQSHVRLRDAARTAGDGGAAHDYDDAAFRWLLRACSLEPNQREPWVELSDYCRQHGDHEGSLWAVGRALAITATAKSHLNDPENWSWRPHDLRSLAAWALGRRDEALEHAFAAVDHAPLDDRLVGNAQFIQLATASMPPSSSGPIVDVVVLAYSRTPAAYEMAKACIASLRASSPDVPARVVVVETHGGLRDEPWTGADAELFGAEVEVVVPGGRFGYNRHVLAGMARFAGSPSPYAMVLNNDVTLFAPGFLRAMLDGLQQVPSVSPLGYREALWGLVDRSVPVDANHDINRAVCGWCLMFDRAILDTLPLDALFPPSFLWYGQDEAYAAALARHGFAHGLVTSARALHLQSRSHGFLGETLDAPADRAEVHRTLGVRRKRCAVVGADAEGIANELAAYEPASVVRANGCASEADDHSLDLVWIDGVDTDQDIGATLRACWPKVRIGGWVAGTGYDSRAVKSAVDAFLQETGLRLAFVTRDAHPAWAMQVVDPPSRSLR
ncbi:MAG: glycosyltransferase [Betaproteobacteria bacterium]